MKKMLLLLFLCLFLFGAAGGAQAYTLVGSFDFKDITYPVNDPDPNALTSPYIDTAENLQVLIDLHNGAFPDISGPYEEYEAPSDFPDDWTSNITIDLSPGYTYLSLKYDNFVDLYYVLGDLTFGPVDIRKGLSHYRLWNPAPVPEPATMLFFGAGLLGLAGIGRKKLMK